MGLAGAETERDLESKVSSLSWLQCRLFDSFQGRSWLCWARNTTSTLILPNKMLTNFSEFCWMPCEWKNRTCVPFLFDKKHFLQNAQIIKKRQPVVEKKRRRATLTSSDATIPDVQAIAEEDKLISLADMIFGGRLTSILVCQKCKHVSQTYEDFNDLSLSIKAEDYAYRKRDRLKNFAKRLTTFPSTSLSMAMEMQRSSSVPPSPREREGSQLGGRNEAPVIPSRRRSLDIATDQDENGTTESDHSNREQNKDRRVEFVEGEKHNGDEGKEKDKKVKKEGQDDTWTKLGRRISVSVGLTKGKGRKTRPAERGSHEFLEANTDIRTSTDTVASEKLKRISLSDPPRPRTPENHPIPETQRLGTPLAKLQEASSTPVLPDPPPPRPSLEHHASSRFSIDHRARSPKPPPATAAETAYLQKILADVGSGSSNPFAIFKPPSLSNGHSYHTGSSGSPQGVWLGLNQFSGLEECLRMFTAVEILDGENMVGCRRCWKIQNGVYSKSSNGVEDDEDSDAEPPSTELSNLASTAASHKTSLSSPGSYFQIPTSASTPVISYFSSNDSSASVSSLPTGITSVSDTDLPSKSVSSLDSHGAPEVVNTPGGLPIPRISTTAPDQANGSSSVSSISLDSEIEDIPTNHHLRYRNGETSVSSFTDSLPVPPRHRHTETDDESSGAESDASASSSYSVNTTTPSSTQGELPTNRLTRKPSRPKPVIMRPAYKRYLIATPPPVLVVHLKRFQQISKTYMMSFSHGFKKLDDYITFPEHLDLTPFLAPKKEDYGLGKRRKLRGKRDGKEKEKCMYRLYAVVVHIGNMVCLSSFFSMDDFYLICIYAAWGTLYCIYCSSRGLTCSSLSCVNTCFYEGSFSNGRHLSQAQTAVGSYQRYERTSHNFRRSIAGEGIHLHVRTLLIPSMFLQL